MVYPGAWKATWVREASTLPICCSETCPRALRSLYCNYYSRPSPSVPLASDFTCNYSHDNKDFSHPPPCPSSSSLYAPSFFPFNPQTNPVTSTSGCKGINLKVTFYPGLGLLSPWRAACHVPWHCQRKLGWHSPPPSCRQDSLTFYL